MRVSFLVLLAALGCGATTVAQNSLSRDTLSQLKEATVFIRASLGRIRSSGSGFLFETEGQTGYIVTNAHVLSNPRLQAAQVDVVFQSGTADEFTVTAGIQAIDHKRDLSVLKVKSERLPKVIALRKPPEVSETLPIYILGYPFGEALSASEGNPAITVSQGSVSSLRRDKFGRLAALQVDGSINPGNSGGPVVTSDGELIGIAVAQIRGAHVGMAIPEEHLEEMLRGNIDFSMVRQLDRNSTRVNVQAMGNLADPKRQVKRILLYVGLEEGMQYPEEPDAKGEYPLANRKMTEHEVPFEKDKFDATLRIPLNPDSPPDILAQLAFERTDGEKVFLKPEVLKPLPSNTRTAQPTPSAESRIPPGPKDSESSQPRGTNKVPGIPSSPMRTVDGSSGADAKKTADSDNPFKRLTPTPETLDRVLGSPPFKVGDADVVKIDLNIERLAVQLAWSADGTSLFVLGANGRVHRLKLPEFRETATIELGGRCSSLGSSSQGLVVGQESQNRIVVLDETTLAVKREITAESFQRVVCVPASSRVCTINWAIIQAVDLVTGVAEPSSNVCTITMSAAGAAAGQPPAAPATIPNLPALAMLAMTPDGRYLIGSTTSGELIRFKFGTGPIVAEEKGPKLSGPPTSIEISGDSAYVALGSDRGNDELPGDSREPNSTYVFPINQLSKPKLRIVSGPVPHCLAFDTVGDKIYAQNHERQLLVYSAQGEKIADFNFGRECGDTRRLLVHPGGNKLCLQTRMRLFFVQLPQ